MKRFALLIALLLAVSVFADYTTEVIVIEEVVTPTDSTIVDEALNAMTDELVEAPVSDENPTDNEFDESVMAELLANSEPAEAPAEEIADVEEIVEVPVEEDVEDVPFSPVDEPTVVPVDESLTVVEEIVSPAQAPFAEDALEVMVDQLEDAETPAPEPTPAAEEVVPLAEEIIPSPTPVPDLAVYDAEGNIVKTEVTVYETTVTIDFKEGPVQGMQLFDVQDASELPRVDEVPPTMPSPEGVWAQIYAIDPVNVEFGHGTVEVVAQGTSLYKCKEWDFDARACNGVWQLIAEDLVPGNTYYLEIGPDDPGFGEVFDPPFLETSPAVDVGVAPINFTKFVVAFIDSAESDASFRIMQTNGTIIVNTTDVDTSVDGDSRIDVGMINASDFVVAWVDGPSDDVTQQIWRFNGTNVTNVTGVLDADTAVGLNTDVSVAEIGDRYFICYANDADDDADFQGFNNTNAASLVAETSVDGDIGPALTLQNLVDCAGINSTLWTYFWFDDPANDATYSILSATGASVVGATDIDADVGETAQVSVTNLNRNSSGLVWYDATDDDISIAVVSSAGVTVAGPLDVDTDAGVESRVAAGTVRQNDTSSEDLFVFAWQDNASADIKASVYFANGTVFTAPFTVDTAINNTFRLIDVTARDSITNNTLCPGRFIVAYSNSTSAGVFRGFFVNGTSWDGTCPGNIMTMKLDSPDPVQAGSTLNYQILLTNIGGDTVFNVTVVDFYPSGIVFNGSSPAPSSGNDTFSLGNISAGSSATINITVNVSSAITDGTVLNNSYNVTFANAGGVNTTITNSTLTIVENDANLTTRLRQIIKGNGTLTAGNSTVINFTVGTGGLPLVNISKAFHVVSYNFSAIDISTGEFSNSLFRSSEIISPTELRIIASNVSAHAVDFEFTIIEFTSDSAIDVQKSGVIYPEFSIFPLIVPFSPISNLSRASILNHNHYLNGTDPTIGMEEFETVRLVNTSSWELNIGVPQDTGFTENRVEIVNWRDPDFIKIVQRGLVDLPDINTSVNVTPPVAVDRNHTLLLVSARTVNGSVFGENASRVGIFATLNESGIINFARSSTGPNMSIAWELVEFQPLAVEVQHVVANFSPGELAKNTTIEPVSPSRSAAFGTVSVPMGFGGSLSNNSNDSQFNNAMFAIRLVSNVEVQATRGASNGTAKLGIQIIEFLGPNVVLNKTDNPDPVAKGGQLNYTILVNNTGFETAFNVTVVETYPPGVVFDSSSPAPSSGNDTWSLGDISGGSSTTINITVNVSVALSNGTILNNSVNATFSDNVTIFNTSTSELTTVLGFPVISTNKSDSPDPVPNGTTLAYQILVENTGDDTAFNVTVVESYPSGVIFNGSSPAPTSGNDTWVFASLAPNASLTINITVNVSASNGTVLNNSYNVTFANVSGVNATVENSTLTTVLGSPVLITIKDDTPDPVVKGSQLNYTILINNTGDDTAFNVTVVETYPPDVVFDSSSPAPTSGNDTWVFASIAPNSSVEINITVNVSGSLANGTILNNSVNATFANVSGMNATVGDSESTTVIGFPVVFTNKTDSPDPVINGTTLSYAILVNNTGDEIAYNVTVVETYPSGVIFNGSSPAPISGNDTFFVGDILPGGFATINITVNVSASNGTVLNNSYNVTFANVSGVNTTVENSTLTTVLGSPVLITIKDDTPDPVVKGSQLNYTILINNTGDDTAFNVTVVETYPPDVVFDSSSPAPTSGNDTWVFASIAPNGSVTINITVNVSSALVNGTILNNSVNATFANVSGMNATVGDSELTTVVGFPVINVTKTDSPDPIANGSTLLYTILVTNTGDDTAFNVTLVESYPINVTFNGSSPPPTSGNDTFFLGDLLPNASVTVNITVNVSISAAGLMNNTVNVTFSNSSGVNSTVNATENTTVIPVLPPPSGGGGGGGGGSGGWAPFAPVAVTEEGCVSGQFVTIGAAIFGPTCCSDQYCKTLGENWECVPRNGLMVCELPVAPEPEAPVQVTVEEPGMPADKISSKISAFAWPFEFDWLWLLAAFAVLGIGALVVLGSMKKK